ncbi:MAG TPA: aldehyde dehydrogenase family protein, partial [Myxococcales bacterium]|nr:aldehyde dehydrogenase family protein [Myxococcales bacterium]
MQRARAAMSEQGFQIDNPYSGETVAERRFLDVREVEGVVARASRAQKAWAKTPLAERLALCERFCAAFEADGERIARE